MSVEDTLDAGMRELLEAIGVQPDLFAEYRHTPESAASVLRHIEEKQKEINEAAAKLVRRLTGDRARVLEFFCFERPAGGPEAAAELAELQQRLQKKTDVEKYRTDNGVDWEDRHGGFSCINVLPELTGLPINDLILAYVQALRPSEVRITRGAMTMNCVPWRVTIIVDEKDIVTSIEQEVKVGYGCGYDVSECLYSARTGKPARPMPSAVCNTAGLARINFE